MSSAPDHCYYMTSDTFTKLDSLQRFLIAFVFLWCMLSASIRHQSIWWSALDNNCRKLGNKLISIGEWLHAAVNVFFIPWLILEKAVMKHPPLCAALFFGVTDWQGGKSCLFEECGSWSLKSKGLRSPVPFLFPLLFRGFVRVFYLREKVSLLTSNEGAVFVGQVV